MLTTITTKEETKDVLAIMKGDRDWDTFLRDLSISYLSMKREETRKKLKGLLIEDFETIKVKKWAREF